MKQIDVFGNEIDYFELNEIPVKETIKEKFRRFNGYLEGATCKTCKYCKTFNYNKKNYHKCEKMGISHSEATDIRLKDRACKLYEEE